MENYLPRVIGLMGKKKSGKDTVAEWLIARHGYERLAFADILKETALKIDPYIVENADSQYVEDMSVERLSALVSSKGWDRTKNEHEEARRFLQELGTSMRSVNDEIWVGPILDEILVGLTMNRRFVITDVRFPNEYQTLMGRFDAQKWRVVRETEADKASEHVSETALDEYDADVTFHNNGSIAALYATVDAHLYEVVAENQFLAATK